MKIIIPMAGLGDRFKNKGYLNPKPLIKVGGKTIIEYIIEIFLPTDEFVFICNEKHLSETNISSFLTNLVPGCKIVSCPEHKKGPVYTVSFAYEHIKDDEEVIISYCDNPYVHDKQDFRSFLQNTKLDGCLISHIGFHPHTLSQTKMAFIKETDGIVSQVKEKECYTSNPENEHASTGTYYFRSGKIVKKYFDSLMHQNISHNGEYYVTLVYNLLIKDGLTVGFYDTPFAMVFGTPEEAEHFEAWKTILSAKQVKTEDDLIKSYRYWKRYYESKI
jgi:NDP-sugar pyrophosphorylase family protein